MIIRGEKVVLRPMAVSEVPIFYKWATQSDATPFWYDDSRIPTCEEFTRDWKRYFFNGSEPEKGRCFVILVDNRAIGQVEYNDINRETHSVELDIIVAEDADKNKGYGTDALKTLVNYLFENMSIQLCWIEAITKNTRAVRAYQKAGFETTKTFLSNGVECNHMELSSKL